MNPDQVEKLVCVARKPGAHFYEQLADEMRVLEASTRGRKLKSSKPDFVADLETTVKEVARVVEADSRENTRQNLPCQFEYQLVSVAKPVNHLKVLTRLFKNGHPQSIFYGRSIARLEDSKFALWVE